MPLGVGGGGGLIYSKHVWGGEGNREGGLFSLADSDL